MTSQTHAAPTRGLALGFAALAAATLGLMVLGALVRAHGAGLACPDWPLCFGEVVPRFDLRVGFEWSHRAVAGLISLGLLGLTLTARLRGVSLGPFVPLAWGLLLVQVLLGALTVWLLLAPWTVTAHLLVGTAFCASLVLVALGLFERSRATPLPRLSIGRGVRVLVFGIALAVLAQIALGGLVSSHGAGLACASFPTCDGTSFVPTLSGLAGLHVLHRTNAYAIVGLFFGLALLTRDAGRLGLLVRTGLQLVLLQVVVGAANVLLRLPVEVTGLHSALAAGLALLTVVILREALRARVVERAAASGRVAEAR